MRLTTYLVSFVIASSSAFGDDRPPIDRHALVTRHNLELTKSEHVQVGNGEFAFTADITGLQTFEPNCTMSHWGWHTSPLPPGQAIDDFKWTIKMTHGRPVEYMAGTGDAISKWLFCNPHRLNLGRIALRMTKADGKPAAQTDLKKTHQTLDLWNGLLTSRFELEDVPVEVTTCCHPTLDAVAVRVHSPLIAARRLKVEVAFPYPDLKEFGGYGDWNNPDAHQTLPTSRGLQRADLLRKLDADEYHVSLTWSTGQLIAGQGADRHGFTVETNSGDTLDFLCAFAPKQLPDSLPSVSDTIAECCKHWPEFWTSGGAVDLSECQDSRAKELERRIVLSQYQEAINDSGSLPSQESGLFNNGWNGKFHFEMYWWHSAHHALWNRWPLLNRSLGIYQNILPSAREKAARQGYQGARWPKNTGPEGRESPHPIDAMLIWQQPHPIFFAELDYRAHPTQDTLEKWKEVLFDTANFMASYAWLNPSTGHYDLGPPLYTVPEITKPDTAHNPAFELSYWRFGLRTAQTWRERLGLARNPEWDKVLNKLAPLPQDDGIYLQEEGLTDTWTQWNHDHPSLVGVFGWLPGDGTDQETVRRTFAKVLQTWQFDLTWGWDFPMLAMCAARLGETDNAVNLLLHRRFPFDTCGMNTSGPCEYYSGNPYFPSNGGLLYAVAMMAAGWDGAPDVHAPGFPQNDQWKVQWEGLKRAP